MKDKVYTETEIKQFAIKKQIKTNMPEFEQYEPQWETLDNVECREQPWFWPAFIPLETITLFAGFGGIGKSLLLLYIIAKTTTGERFMAGGIEHDLLQGSVILLSAEDDPQTQIVPKLIAEGADTSKVHFIKSKVGKVSKAKKFLELDKDLHIIKNKIIELKEKNEDVRLIVIDPIAYFLGNVKDYANTEVANFLQGLIDLAKEYGIAVLINKHLRKQGSGSKGATMAADEVAGAGAWINTPRKCWLITNWHEDSDIKVISNLKDNLAKKSEDCLSYKITGTTIEFKNTKIQTTRLLWQEKLITLTSDMAVSEDQYDKTKHKQAVKFIYDYLKANGQTRIKVIRDKAAAASVCKERTFRDALREFEEIYKDNLTIKPGVGKQKMYMLIED